MRQSASCPPPWLLLLLPLSATTIKHENALRRSQIAAAAEHIAAGTATKVPLLVVIFTQRRNEERRRWQRRTWLHQAWVRGELGSTGASAPRVSWRYVYMQARSHESRSVELDQLEGDTVTLSAVRESYENLVYKTLEAVRWALRHVAFGVMLKTDDDTMVHVGRVDAWLHSGLSTRRRSSLYAGRVFNDSQIIYENYTKASLLHPEWYPDDFLKWAIPHESYAGGLYYPPYCSGGGYLLGSTAARSILGAYDARTRASRPIVRVEDAFVGILAEESAVASTDLTSYVQDPPARQLQDAALFSGRMLVHRVAEPDKAFAWIAYPVRMDFYDKPGAVHRARTMRPGPGKRGDSPQQASTVSRTKSTSRQRRAHLS
jgi:hypothetical protein